MVLPMVLTNVVISAGVGREPLTPASADPPAIAMDVGVDATLVPLPDAMPLSSAVSVVVDIPSVRNSVSNKQTNRKTNHSFRPTNQSDLLDVCLGMTMRMHSSLFKPRENGSDVTLLYLTRELIFYLIHYIQTTENTFSYNTVWLCETTLSSLTKGKDASSPGL